MLIVGQGLAGTVLSETLAARGLRVMLFDAPREGRASWVAAGAVNPIVLRRTVATWRASEMLAVSGAFYREMEQRHDAHFWHPLPVVELFATPQDAGIWRLRSREPELGRLLTNGPVEDPGLARLPQPYGHGVVPRSAWLDMQRMLSTHRSHWVQQGCLVEREVALSDVQEGTDGVSIGTHHAHVLIWCVGPFAITPGLVPVRGEGLTVRMPGLGLKSIVHRGVFVVPLGQDRYRVGATFAWDDVWSGPTEEGQRYLLDRLARLWSGPVEVLEHWAGVRPTARDRRPILGRTSAHQAVFNGLGSRGAMLAPWCAAHLADHLFAGRPLDAEVDVARFTA